MTSSRYSFAVILGVMLCSLFPASADHKVDRTAEIKLSRQIAKDSANLIDLCATMAGMGIDFPVLVQRALEGKKEAIRLLVWAGENVPLDGAAAEGYSFTLVKVAKKLGDEKLASVMEGVEAASPVNTRMFFEFEFGAGNDEAGASEEIKKLFPKFWSQVLERTVSR